MVFFTQDVPPSVLTALNHANDSDVVPADLTAATLDDMDTGVGFLDSLSPYTALRDLHTPLTTYSIPATEASHVMSADTDIDPCPSTLDVDTSAPGTALSMISAISDDNVPSDLPITGVSESGVTHAVLSDPSTSTSSAAIDEMTTPFVSSYPVTPHSSSMVLRQTLTQADVNTELSDDDDSHNPGK